MPSSINFSKKPEILKPESKRLKDEPVKSLERDSVRPAKKPVIQAVRALEPRFASQMKRGLEIKLKTKTISQETTDATVKVVLKPKLSPKPVKNNDVTSSPEKVQTVSASMSISLKTALSIELFPFVDEDSKELWTWRDGCGWWQ